MKVVFLDTTLDGSLFGGAHTFLHKILRGLFERGVETHFVTKGKPSPKAAKYIERSGADFHNQLWPASSLVEDAAPVLAKWLIMLDPDVFVVSVSPDIGWVVLPYLPSRIATITIGHNDSSTFYEPARHYSPFLTKAIGVSTEICRKYVSVSGMKEENVVWIPYGVESAAIGPTAAYQSSSTALNLVYAGRLEEEQKRSSDLVGIIQLLQKKGVDFHFNIIGDGPSYKHLKSALAHEISLGLVQMTGWLNNVELIRYLHASDLFILTSAFEGFCISLVEAMANGCCPIATDIESGNKQLISNGKNGYIVPVGDITGFVERIQFLASNRDKLIAFRQAAWEVGKTFSIDRMVDRYHDCFIDAIAMGGKAPRLPNPDYPLMESCRSKYPVWLRRIKAKVTNK